MIRFPLIVLTLFVLGCMPVFVTLAQSESPPGSELTEDELVDLKVRATAGDAEAQFQLGEAIANRSGGRDGGDWLLKAAEQGHVRAQNLVGGFYSYGMAGLREDWGQALHWRKQAALQGSPLALSNMGYMLSGKDGGEAYLVTAYAYLLIAEAAGYEETYAPFNARVVASLSASELAKAKELTKGWRVGELLPEIASQGRLLELENSPALSPPQDMSDQTCRPTTPRIRCTSKCVNGDCVVTYENGCKVRIQVSARYDGFQNRWVYPSPSC